MNPIFIYLSIGLVAGVFSGLFGLGGGIIIVPLLVFFFKMNMTQASATSLVMFLLPVGALGVWKYYSAGIIQSSHIKMGLIIGMALMLGSFFGAKLSTHLNPQTLQKAFAVVLFIVSVRMWMTSK